MTAKVTRDSYRPHVDSARHQHAAAHFQHAAAKARHDASQQQAAHLKQAHDGGSAGARRRAQQMGHRQQADDSGGPGAHVQRAMRHAHNDRPESLLSDKPKQDPSNCLSQAAKTGRDGKDNIVFLKDTGKASDGVGHVVVQNAQSGQITDPEALTGQKTRANLPSYLKQLNAAQPGHRYAVDGSAPAEDVHAVLAQPAGKRADYIAQHAPKLAGIERHLYADSGGIEYVGGGSLTTSAYTNASSSTDSSIESNNAIGTLAKAPLLPQSDIQSIHSRAIQTFLDHAQKNADGSDFKTTYNLYKTLALASQVPELQGHVDVFQAQRDLQTYLQKPDIQTEMYQDIDDAATRVTGQSGDQIVRGLSDYLTDPNTIAALATLRQNNPDAANDIVNDTLGQVALFNPGAARDLLKNYVKANVDPSNPGLALAGAKPDVVQKSVQSAFQVGITEARFGLGTASNAFTALARLSPTEQTQAANAYANALTAAADNATGETGSFSADAVNAFLETENLPASVRDSVKSFSSKLTASGGFQGFSAALAGIAVYQDFAGSGTATTQTAWGRVKTAGDFLSLFGAGGEALTKLGGPIKSLYKLGESGVIKAAGAPAVTEALGGGEIELTNAGAVANALRTNATLMAEIQSGALSSADVTEFADAVSHLSGQSSLSSTEFLSALESPAASSSLASLASDATLGSEIASAGTIDTESAASLSEYLSAQSASVGLTTSEADTAGAEIASLADESAGVGKTAISKAGLALKGLGVLASVGELLYGAGAAKNAASEFQQGDNIDGALDTATAAGLTTSGTIGLGAAAFETAAAFGVEGAAGSIFTGPGAAIAAGVGLVVGFGAGIGKYFHQKHVHDKQIADLEEFLQNGVGTGNNYYAPEFVQNNAMTAQLSQKIVADGSKDDGYANYEELTQGFEAQGLKVDPSNDQLEYLIKHVYGDGDNGALNADQVHDLLNDGGLYFSDGHVKLNTQAPKLAGALANDVGQASGAGDGGMSAKQLRDGFAGVGFPQSGIPLKASDEQLGVLIQAYGDGQTITPDQLGTALQDGALTRQKNTLWVNPSAAGISHTMAKAVIDKGSKDDDLVNYHELPNGLEALGYVLKPNAANTLHGNIEGVIKDIAPGGALDADQLALLFSSGDMYLDDGKINALDADQGKDEL
ncbi:hypothetical protein [Salinisphaera sp.]|uniref:hypothetical protein n=1 Tax=Salinisphaera sp. TaxID=1914330 RepID=UPI002D798AB0|nr:hypothetical protein [Salinisphaera sp.]HET7313668.1 hypothetical protein [Salinisphaera sp.]